MSGRISGWRLAVELSTGDEYQMSGFFLPRARGAEVEEMLTVVEGMAAGIRATGHTVHLVIERKTEEER